MTDTIVLDFETFYHKGKFSLGGSRKYSMTRYIMDEQFMAQSLASYNVTTGERQFSWYDEIKDHVADLDLADKTVIAHNNYFDSAILAWRYGVVPQRMICTASLSRALIGTAILSHSLDSVAEHLGCAPKLKSMLDEFDGMKMIPGDIHDPETPAGRMKIYNEQDVETTAQVLNKQMQMDGALSQIWPIDWAVRQFVDSLLELDVPLLKKQVRERTANDKKLYESIGIPKTSFTSQQKFIDLLGAAGVAPPVKVSEKTGKESPALGKDDPEFIELCNHPYPMVRNLCIVRQHAASNIETTRAKTMVANAGLTPNGAWPLHVLHSGAMQTHRLSGADGAGGNPLNLPRKSPLRSAIKPRSGYLFYTVDQSAFELRIARQLAGDIVATDVIYNGGDTYKDFASVIYEVDIDEVTDEQRSVGKMAQLALQYGVGAATMQKRLLGQGIKLEFDAVKRIVDLFRYTRHSAVTDYWKWCADFAVPKMLGLGTDGGEPMVVRNAPFMTVEKECIRLPSDALIDYRELHYNSQQELQFLSYSYTDKAGKGHLYPAKIYQHMCQSLANEILVPMKREVEIQTGFRVVMEVYDEITVAVDDDLDPMEMDQVRDEIDTILSRPPKWWPQLQLEVKGSFGSNYGEAK